MLVLIELRHPFAPRRSVLEIAREHVAGVQAAMGALARYRLADAADAPYGSQPRHRLLRSARDRAP